MTQLPSWMVGAQLATEAPATNELPSWMEGASLVPQNAPEQEFDKQAKWKPEVWGKMSRAQKDRYNTWLDTLSDDGKDYLRSTPERRQQLRKQSAEDLRATERSLDRIVAASGTEDEREARGLEDMPFWKRQLLYTEQGMLQIPHVGRALGRAEQGFADTAQAFVSLGGRMAGSESVVESVRKEKALRERYLELIESGDATEELMGERASRIFNGVSRTIPKVMAIGATAGTAGTLTTIGAESFDSSLNEADAAGLTGGKRLAYAGTMAGIEVGVTLLTGALGKKFGFSTLEEGLDPAQRSLVKAAVMKSGIGKGIAKLAEKAPGFTGASAEGAEEAVTSILQQFTDQVATGKKFDWNGVVDSALTGVFGAGAAKSSHAIAKKLEKAFNPENTKQMLEGYNAAKKLLDPPQLDLGMDDTGQRVEGRESAQKVIEQGPAAQQPKKKQKSIQDDPDAPQVQQQLDMDTVSEGINEDMLGKLIKPLNQNEFAQLTGMKKTSATMRESFRQTLEVYAMKLAKQKKRVDKQKAGDAPSAEQAFLDDQTRQDGAPAQAPDPLQQELADPDFLSARPPKQRSKLAADIAAMNPADAAAFWGADAVFEESTNEVQVDSIFNDQFYRPDDVVDDPFMEIEEPLEAPQGEDVAPQEEVAEEDKIAFVPPDPGKQTKRFWEKDEPAEESPVTKKEPEGADAKEVEEAMGATEEVEEQAELAEEEAPVNESDLDRDWRILQEIESDEQDSGPAVNVLYDAAVMLDEQGVKESDPEYQEKLKKLAVSLARQDPDIDLENATSSAFDEEGNRVEFESITSGLNYEAWMNDVRAGKFDKIVEDYQQAKKQEEFEDVEANKLTELHAAAEARNLSLQAAVQEDAESLVKAEPEEAPKPEPKPLPVEGPAIEDAPKAEVEALAPMDVPPVAKVEQDPPPITEEESGATRAAGRAFHLFDDWQVEGLLGKNVDQKKFKRLTGIPGSTKKFREAYIAEVKARSQQEVEQAEDNPLVQEMPEEVRGEVLSPTLMNWLKRKAGEGERVDEGENVKVKSIHPATAALYKTLIKIKDRYPQGHPKHHLSAAAAEAVNNGITTAKANGIPSDRARASYDAAYWATMTWRRNGKIAKEFEQALLEDPAFGDLAELVRAEPKDVEADAPKEMRQRKRGGGRKKKGLKDLITGEDGAIRFSEADAGLIRARVGRWIKENLHSARGRIQPIDQANDKRLGEFAYHIKELDQLLSDLNRTVKKFGGKNSLTAEQMEEINGALRGQKTNLHEDILESINPLRAKIDALSQQAIDLGITEDALELTFEENMGMYINRAYQKHTDKNWAHRAKQDLDLMGRFDQWLREQYPEDTPQQRAWRTNVLLYKDSAASDADFPGGTADAGFLGILKQKQDVPGIIRELWGEYRDPWMNASNTVTKLAQLVAEKQFVKEVKDLGLAHGFLAEEGKAAPDQVARLTGKSHPALKDLEGLYTHPDVARSLDRLSQPEFTGGIFRAIVGLNGLVKWNATVGNLKTHARNFVGNTAFAMSNGDIVSKSWPKAIRTVWHHLTNMPNSESREYIRELARFRLIDNDLTVSEITEMSNYTADLGDFSPSAMDGPIGAFKRTPMGSMVVSGKKMLDKAYQAGDAVWKILAYENKKQHYRKVHPNATEAEIKELAAKDVISHYPSFHKTPRAVKVLSQFPMAAPFISFQSEMVRCTYNVAKTAAREIRDPNPEVRKMGMQRAAGTVMSLGMLDVLAATSQWMMGVSDDEALSLRNFMAPWAKWGSHFFFGKPENGVYRVTDLSYMDARGSITKAVRAGMAGDVGDAMKMVFDPLGEDILAGKVFDLVRNQTSTGAEVYTEDADAATKAGQMAAHLGGSFLPGTFNHMDRVLKGMKGEVSRSGKAYEAWAELVSVFGARVDTIDVAQSMRFKNWDYRSRVSNLQSKALRPAFSQGTEPVGNVSKAYERHNEYRKQVVTEWHERAMEAIRLGVPEQEVKKQLVNQAGREMAKMVYSGVYKPYKPSKSALKEIYQKPDGRERVKQLIGSVREAFERERQLRSQ